MASYLLPALCHLGIMLFYLKLEAPPGGGFCNCFHWFRSVLNYKNQTSFKLSLSGCTKEMMVYWVYIIYNISSVNKIKYFGNHLLQILFSQHCLSLAFVMKCQSCWHCNSSNLIYTFHVNTALFWTSFSCSCCDCDSRKLINSVKFFVTECDAKDKQNNNNNNNIVCEEEGDESEKERERKCKWDIDSD